MEVHRYHLRLSSKATSISWNGSSRTLQMHCKPDFYTISDQLILNVDKRLGYSKKGWTDCELAILWLTHFEKHTSKKANGHARLLVVDGHNSHYSFEFLDYARTHKIHVLCYPAHTTHVYQGLDVVVFSVLKRYWAEERIKWEASGGEVSKETFLTIYGTAHTRTLSPALVKKAFEKTGIWPFNPDVISTEMMAPSKETSQKGYLPFTPSTPIRNTARQLKHMLQPAPLINPVIPDIVDDVTAVIDSVMHQLRDPAVGYLTRDSPIKPTAQLPPIPTATLSPIKQQLPRLQHNPTTSLERELITKLQDAAIKEAYLKGKIAGLQSTTILQDAYLHRVQGQLGTKEGKKNKGSGALNDGHARLLTDNEFVEKVAERDKQKALKQAEKDWRKVVAADRWMEEGRRGEEKMEHKLEAGVEARSWGVGWVKGEGEG